MRTWLAPCLSLCLGTLLVGCAPETGPSRSGIGPIGGPQGVPPGFTPQKPPGWPEGQKWPPDRPAGLPPGAVWPSPDGVFTVSTKPTTSKDETVPTATKKD